MCSFNLVHMCIMIRSNYIRICHYFLSQQHLPPSERVVYSSIERFFVTLSFGECLACALDYPLSILEPIFNLLTVFCQLRYNLFSHAVINLASQFINGVMLFLSSAAIQVIDYQSRNQQFS